VVTYGIMNDALHTYETKLRRGLNKLRGLLLKFYLKAHGCTVGKGLKCKQWPTFRQVPARNITIGDHVNSGYAVTFDVGKEGSLILGNTVNLTQNIVPAAGALLSIGDNTLIAENVSIRDGDHGYEGPGLIADQPCSYEGISIGKDVWIGAHSLVLKNSEIEPYSVNVGIPVRTIASRTKKEI
jgi:carbonic anhydrase/acetyltransferase-like protein (isoleucine patch superfamily)